MGTRRVASQRIVSKRPRTGGGRPTRAQAVRRDARLLDVATGLFLKHGFDGTSIDAVARLARVGKPTIYARYSDKKALFIAVLRRRVDDANAQILQTVHVGSAQTRAGSVETALHEFSRRAVAHMLAPDNVTFQRMVAAHAARLPELAQLADVNRANLTRQIAAALRHFTVRGQIASDDPDMSADQFISLVLGHPLRAVLYGSSISARSAERYRKAAVVLFLDALRPR
ncbi:TetR/AcrR family transcriptional regulator [Bradyrhizobium prioriisuperbiae]|uniref:TetR/AcrR family transcriptional regulator n=1 Tax=Bradyrhizobium prioriisuperbiae TaxID=2854389 RepID=UPI0028EA084A|nr:TetR/AcrR family transcriptional regulator [Bradyrhizobium prioritasuperba]